MPGDCKICVKVKGQDGEEIIFRVKRSSRLRKLMESYADQKSLSVSSFVFLFEDHRISSDQTPKELEMEEGDTISAMLPQTGGGGCLPNDLA